MNFRKVFEITILSLHKIKFRDYGLGMTEEVLINHFWQVCKSSKTGKAYLIGKFGIGALAKVYICRTLELRSRNIKDGTTLISTMDMNILEQYDEATGELIPPTNPDTDYLYEVLGEDDSRNLECQGTEITVEFPEPLHIDTLNDYIREVVMASKYTDYQSVISVQEVSLQAAFVEKYGSNPFQTMQCQLVVFPTGHEIIAQQVIQFEWLAKNVSVNLSFLKYRVDDGAVKYRIGLNNFSNHESAAGWMEVSPNHTCLQIFKQGYYTRTQSSLCPGRLLENWT